MAAVLSQHLSELVEVADVAVRVASQLRLAKSDQPPIDTECLAHAIEFLNRAATGAAFMSGQEFTSLHFDGSLEPLNWVIDAYLQTVRAPQTQEVDYNKVAEHVARLAECLRAVQQRTANHDSVLLITALAFFETAGGILGSRADRMLRHEPHEFPLAT